MSVDISNSSVNGETKEDIPEYRKITNENMYEFIIWANEKKSSDISVDYFNMIIQSNI